jgi:hypothetical protein
MSSALKASRALWNRSALDLRSDEQLAQIMDRGALVDWAELHTLAAGDPSLRARMRGVVERVAMGFPGFWLATLASLGEPAEWDRPLPKEVGT